MKVAIVCGSPSTEFLAPFNDESWEVWVLGNRLDRFKDKRVTRVFEIHEDLSEHQDPEAYCEFLASSGHYLIVGENFPINNADIEVFPYKEAQALSKFVTLASSPAYMMAYAILNGATEIAIYGVDMAVDDHEYFWQRPCMWGWVRFAEGRGIKITIPEQSALCKMNYIEGKDWKAGFKHNPKSQFALPPFTEQAFNELAENHQKKIDQINEEIRQKEILIHTHNGAKQSYIRMAKVARAVESGQENLTLLSTTITK